MAGENIARVGIVGAGRMGAGIAEVCARAQCDVLVHEQSRDLVAAGRTRILDSLGQAVSSGTLTGRERDHVSSRLRFTTDLADFDGRDLVIEAIVEDEVAKTELLGRLDAVVGSATILASNTSSIPIGSLSAATSRPRRVVGMHFFHPVPALPLMELVTTAETDDDVARRVREFAHDVLGKHVICSSDRSGFVVNAILMPYLLSAVRMVENGFATVDDIDTAMVLGVAHPLGPLRLADLVGLDTVVAIAERMHSEFDEPMYAAPALLRRMVAQGRLGKKSGHGFYRYGDRVVADI
ncbi:3-hydroxybutyryl-CoA dehydrogenase [Gordonia sp. HY002]|uniref:3-hydroxybutyryl-CoA dehydrogenase n=1 Tax=Gordonia zhenghanii TaxID=2911516 RepID=UPI001EF1191F|nr:3-hydroxybutyryl-CoA dehydrogenase [Gordonia zhenghanii]MCF8569046.1 3-hydroxybutyryl-CoA dehydrogenase [Gordonia zhenghanii]MCF8605244.1 3-hydroxybutyryl-CoA dehydrogenase [Gordonia zhenghanii]